MVEESLLLIVAISRKLIGRPSGVMVLDIGAVAIISEELWW